MNQIYVGSNLLWIEVTLDQIKFRFKRFYIKLSLDQIEFV